MNPFVDSIPLKFVRKDWRFSSCSPRLPSLPYFLILDLLSQRPAGVFQVSVSHCEHLFSVCVEVPVVSVDLLALHRAPFVLFAKYSQGAKCNFHSSPTRIKSHLMDDEITYRHMEAEGTIKLHYEWVGIGNKGKFMKYLALFKIKLYIWLSKKTMTEGCIGTFWGV